MKAWILTGVGVTVLGAASLGAMRFTRMETTVPTAEVKRGEFIGYLQLRGEIKALKTVTITAPFRAGDLRIVKLAANGGQVKKGGVLVQFDNTKLLQDLEQSRSDLNRVNAEIEQSRAKARMKEEQDMTDVMTARYDLQAAKLDASKQEIVSKIEGAEAMLKVADAEQKVRETNERLKADRAAAAAELESKKQTRDKALFALRQAEQSNSVMTLKAPIDGMVTLLSNWRAAGPFGGRVEFKEGDSVWPGAAIAELPDLSTLRVDTRADETDRARLAVGQRATVRADAVPDREFSGVVSEISTLASTDFSGPWPFPRNFDLKIKLEESDARLRPGMNTTVRVIVDRAPNSILIPSESAFEKSGKTVVYVLRGSKFEERAIEVAKRGEAQLAVESGLAPGERVALKDPTVQK